MKKKIFIVLFLCFTVLPYSDIVIAQTQQDYTVLAPLPDTVRCSVVNGKEECKTDFATYLPKMFNLIVGVAAVLAFIMITIGGITYATSDAISGKSQGREYVTNALTGLLLVLGAYTILYTINPEILNFNLLVTPPNIQGSEPTVVSSSPKPCCTYTGKILDGYTLTTAEINQNAIIISTLLDNSNNSSVSVNNGGKACVNGETSGCTNVVGLPNNAISGVKNLKSNCGSCVVIITGGTEGGHETHGPGKAVIDLDPRPALNKFLLKEDRYPKKGDVKKFANGTYTFEPAGTYEWASGDHWHVVYN